jgi:hypothetical protein
VNPIEADVATLNATLNGDEARTPWQKPQVTRLVAQGAEAGDNFSGEGGSSFS